MFEFPNDMLPVPVQPNRLNDQILVRYYERDWAGDDPLTTTRRQFLSAALLALTPKSERPITGSFVNEDFRAGPPAARPLRLFQTRRDH